MLGTVTRRRALWLALAVVLLVVAAVTTAALLQLSPLVRRAVLWQLQSATGRPVTIAALDLSLADGRLSLRGLRVADHDGGVLAEVGRLEATFRPWSLLHGELWIEDLAVSGVQARIVRIGPGRFNISDLLDRPASSGSGRDVSIDHHARGDSQVTFEDRLLQPARTWRADDIRFDGRRLTTRGRGGTAVAFANVAGALVTVRADDVQLGPLHARANVNVRDLDLRLAALYLPGDGALRLERGRLNAGLHVVIDGGDGTRLDADAVIEGLALRRPGVAEDTVTAPRLDILVRELHQQPARTALRYASVGGNLTVLDPTQTPPRPLTFTDLTVTASDLEQPMKDPARVAMHANVPGGGEVDVTGTVGVTPRRADLRVRARGLELAALASHLPLTARVAGTGTADLRVTATHERAFGLTVAGDATVDRVTLGDGTRTLLAATRVSARGLEYTWPASLALGQLTLTQPAATIERAADGTLDLTALLRPPTPAEAAAPASPASATVVPDVRITSVRIDDGRATIADAALGGTAEITGVGLTGRDVTWPPRGTSPVDLTATVARGRLTARGTIDGAQRRGEIALTLRGADLATLQSWLPINGRVAGAVDADLTAIVGLDPFSLSARGSVATSNLAFHDASRPLLTVARAEMTGIDLQWPARLAIDRLRVNTPWAQIDRTPEGELSLRALFRRRPERPGAPAPVVSPPAAGLVPGLELSLREALFENGGTNIVDDAVEPAARLEIRGSRLALRNLTWPAAGASTVQLSTPMPGGGVLKASGTFSIEPTQLRLDAELDQVDLAPGRPYLPFDARIAGKVTGRAKISGEFGDTITLVVDGDAAVDRLALGDLDRRLATVQRVELSGVRYRYPTSVRVRQLTLRKPWALVERNAGGDLEVVSLLGRRRAPLPTPAAAAPSATTPAASTPPRVRFAVDKLTLEEGFLRFVDRTTHPDYAEELGGITMTAEGLGTNPRRNGTIDLRGTLASGTAVGIRGQISAFTERRFLDLTVDVKDFPVPRLNPYLDQLSSWIARQGVLTAAMRYRLDGDALEASNDVTVVGLELNEGGRGTAVQQRIGLPLGLLVSLLKNSQGVIHLDIPVRGQLSSPEFDYGDAVWTALRGLAIKLVSLPFSWIGRIGYTEDARIESVQVYPVPFETARPAPTAFGRDQLQRLAAFLKEQPAIRLRLRPVTTVADVTAVRRDALTARLATAGDDPAARRQAAVAMYAELFPRRQPPPTDEALLEELTKETPTPPGALRTLVTARAATVRDALVQGGVVADRLQPAEARAAVEGEGDPRVEFEIVR